MIDNHANDLCPSLATIAAPASPMAILAVSGVPFALFGDLRLHGSVDVRHGLHDGSVVCILT